MKVKKSVWACVELYKELYGGLPITPAKNAFPQTGPMHEKIYQQRAL